MIKNRIINTTLFGILLVISIFSFASCWETGGSRKPKTNVPPSDGKAEFLDVCCGNLFPTGYIKINDSWSPTSCGSPTSSWSKNKCKLQRYDNKPIGSSMWVCTGIIPPGWQKIDDKWDPTACGSPQSSWSKNMMQIQKIGNS